MARAQAITTEPRDIDIEALFSELTRLRRDAVRLHPIRGKPSAASSHVGAPILWPADEPWPTSDEPQHPLLAGFDDETMGIRTVRRRNRTFVPVLQLRREDVPTLPFPEGHDLFQLLWNPRAHRNRWSAPLVRVFWRVEASIGIGLSEVPPPEVPEEELVPRPCVVHPESIAEYPCPLALPAALRRRIEAWDVVEEGEEDQARYQYQLSVAPGLKLGGHPYFHIIDPVQPRCPKKHAMELLLTVDPCEWDGAGQAWRARRGKTPLREDNPTGMRIGRDGSLFVFICRRCPGWPIDVVQQ